ncbi:MAG: hypothetical protein CM1200mP35_05480 [Chloroflexota bacterium]|nr:MAG: hypothetical protein CM1200mP35_05480 [Chloroflexota bacterium]
MHERLRLAIGDKDSSVHFISAATGEGVAALMGQIYSRFQRCQSLNHPISQFLSQYGIGPNGHLVRILSIGTDTVCM